MTEPSKLTLWTLAKASNTQYRRESFAYTRMYDLCRRLDALVATAHFYDDLETGLKKILQETPDESA